MYSALHVSEKTFYFCYKIYADAFIGIFKIQVAEQIAKDLCIGTLPTNTRRSLSVLPEALITRAVIATHEVLAETVRANTAAGATLVDVYKDTEHGIDALSVR